VSRGINWIFAITIVGFHLGAIAALLSFRWSGLVVFLVTWILAQNVGIAMGYHRLLTHRGYSTPKWVEYSVATCGTLSLQGGPIYWVAVHRMHHRYTDKSGDPHSPRDGKWWSHMGWILNGTLRNETKVLRQYAPDLIRERYYRWLNQYHWVPLTVVGLSLFALGGWPWLLWGAVLPVTIGFHVTWMVNSVTHLWGSRRFSTSDDSCNNLLVALLTGGEGWHNNHHAYPVSARHGLAWYEVDLNYYGIRFLEALGLAAHVKTFSLKSAPDATGRVVKCDTSVSSTGADSTAIPKIRFDSNVSSDGSPVTLRVFPAEAEIMIARQRAAVVGMPKGGA
jgi:stearoyl-CoA desaturase (delta-9 desaturase)